MPLRILGMFNQTRDYLPARDLDAAGAAETTSGSLTLSHKARRGFQRTGATWPVCDVSDDLCDDSE